MLIRSELSHFFCKSMLLALKLIRRSRGEEYEEWRAKIFNCDWGEIIMLRVGGRLWDRRSYLNYFWNLKIGIPCIIPLEQVKF